MLIRMFRNCFPVSSLAALALLACLPAEAAWELDNARSALKFMSVKNKTIAELHHFKSMTGGISDSGLAQLVIDLDSVETLVPIRNQRLRELFFETVRFPSATLTVAVPEALNGLGPGETATWKIDATIELHGMSGNYSVYVMASHAEDGSLRVVLREPLVLKVADFGLAAGVDILREVAGLDSISPAIPVSGYLVFTPVQDS
ncbi:MAG: polyisoprenoid-binding protein YceI [Halieaceae bacterium]